MNTSSFFQKIRHPKETHVYREWQAGRYPIKKIVSIMKGYVRDTYGRYAFSWSTNGGVSYRQFKNYEQYLAIQKDKFANAKITRDEISAHDIQYRSSLRKRLTERDGDIVKPGMSVLCLAARFGTEVKAFLDRGCFAVGIDLEPGQENKYVVYGDFSDIQFPNESADIVFTNSMDHAYDLKKLISEMRRVLKPGGHVIIEIMNGRDKGFQPGFYESAVWQSVDDVVALFADSGFTVLKRTPIKYPWSIGGEHISFQLK